MLPNEQPDCSARGYAARLLVGVFEGGLVAGSDDHGKPATKMKYHER